MTLLYMDSVLKFQLSSTVGIMYSLYAACGSMEMFGYNIIHYNVIHFRRQL